MRCLEKRRGKASCVRMCVVALGFLALCLFALGASCVTPEMVERRNARLENQRQRNEMRERSVGKLIVTGNAIYNGRPVYMYVPKIQGEGLHANYIGDFPVLLPSEEPPGTYIIEIRGAKFVDDYLIRKEAVLRAGDTTNLVISELPE